MWWFLFGVWILWACYMLLAISGNKYSYRVIKNNYADDTVEYALQYRIKYQLGWSTFTSTYCDKQDAINAMQRQIELDAKQARKVTKKEVIKT